ncbi:hypothetical protein [Zobellia barbeyronii]|uniref:Uncharacterized protein n=1 Tax=Zobellia barbeyronii TaxID=2748009 RepID=A0ABS5WC51_9FLAO|nr:hypothetical protein [Zobellia barbeyronii]MBT2160483.1 hypothetical protein [Zobellia barbeyronii]
MKTFVLILFFLSIYQNSFCQEKVFCIVNQITSEEVFLKEHQRIKVITKIGEKFEGKFSILDQNTIAVNGVILVLNEISTIRKNPLGLTIFLKAFFFHTGAVTLVLSALLSGFAMNLSYVLVGVAVFAGGIYGGIKPPNLKKGYKTSDNWEFTIKSIKIPLQATGS